MIDVYKESTRIYHPIHLLTAMLESKRSNEVNLTDTTVGELKKVMVEKIQIAANDGSLKNEEELLAILYRWKDWESSEVVSNFIKEMISTREGLLNFLQKCIGRVLSSNGNYNMINQKSIEGLYSLDEITNLVNAISDDDIQKMNEKEQEAIDLFKNPKER